MSREYFGYYVDDSPPMRPYRRDSSATQQPLYGEYHRYSMRSDAERFRGSRSPSPSPALAFRDRSYSVRSAGSAPLDPLYPERAPRPASGLRNSGPTIVDSSDDWSGQGFPPVEKNYPQRASTSEVMENSDSSLDFSAAARARHSGLPSPYNVATAMPENRHLHVRPTTNSIRGINGTSNGVQNGSVELADERLRHANRARAPSGGNKKVEAMAQLTNGLGIVYDENRPMKQPMPTEQAANKPSSNSQAIGEIRPEISELRQEKPSGAAPLLSPVREVRTPSPAMSRKDEFSPKVRSVSRFAIDPKFQIPPFSKERYLRSKQPENKANSTPSREPESSKAPAAPMSNGWQQQSKKGKKHKSKGSTASISSVLAGEPMPANEADRKGG